MPILYMPIQETNYINCYKPIFHTKKIFSYNNNASLHLIIISVLFFLFLIS